jgi:predicted RNA-binding Zn ribbon-like protein
MTAMAGPLETPAPPSSGPFELSGGALCLDYVNTWGDRARPETDQLRSFADVLAFAGQTGLLDAPHQRRLELRSPAAPDAPGGPGAFDTALDLRESLYRIFAGLARGREAPVRDLARLNAVLKEGLAHLRVEAQPPGRPPAFAWSFEPADLATAPLWPIARSAAELLVSPDLPRVTQCDGSNCTWLFLDLSRSRNRRWCSMQSCGNRAKARRHYRRSKG